MRDHMASVHGQQKYDQLARRSGNQAPVIDTARQSLLLGQQEHLAH